MSGPWEKYQQSAPTAKGPWEKYTQAEEPAEDEGLGGKVLGAVATAGEYVDRFTGAPVRAGIKAAQEGRFMDIPRDEWNQFGEDTKTAPTAKSLVMNAGVSDKPFNEMFGYDKSQKPSGLIGKLGNSIYPEGRDAAIDYASKEKGMLGKLSPADVAGFGLGIASDPTTYISAGAIGKGIGKVAELGSQGVKKTAGLLGRGLRKAAGELSGVGAENVARYAAKTPEINEMVGKYGTDFIEAADDFRSTAHKDLQNFKSIQNDKIEESLKDFRQMRANNIDPKATISNKPIIESLESSRSRINKKLNPEAWDEFQDVIDRVNRVSENGMMAPDSAYDVQKYLRSLADGTYGTQASGKVFQPGSEIAKAANRASSVTRKIVNTEFPMIKDANNMLSQLHTIEDSANKGLLKAGATATSIGTAGSGTNKQALKTLQRIDKLTGSGLVDKAKDFSTYQEFAEPSIFPKHSTGKSLLGVAAAKVASTATGPAAWAGLALASPAVIKAGINAGRITAKTAARLLPDAQRLGNPEVIKLLKAAAQVKRSKEDIEK